jgi:hypothetical protein
MARSSTGSPRSTVASIGVAHQVDQRLLKLVRHRPAAAARPSTVTRTRTGRLHGRDLTQQRSRRSHSPIVGSGMRASSE